MTRKATLTVMLLIAAMSIRGESVQMSLEDVMMYARCHSVDASMAVNSLRSSYWAYRSYRADLLPEVSLSATIPSYSRQYSSYQNPDGTFDFVHTSALEMNGNLNVSQSIWFTGGTLSLSTSLDFLRQLGRNAYSRFMTVPVALRLNQPLFGVNNVKWNRRIEPLRYRIAEIQFLTATENVAIEAMRLYFSLILAREDLNTQSKNLTNAEKLLDIARVKRNMGKISENEVLQLELNVLNARSALTSAGSNLTQASFNLTSYLGLDPSDEVIPSIPEMPPHIDVTFDEVYTKAIENGSHDLDQRLSRLNADYSVASAKGNQRNVNLNVQVGFTGTGNEASTAYARLQNNQMVQVGISVPILDWGKRRGRVKMAQSQREVTLSRLKQQDTQYRQNIFVLVDRFNSQQKQVEIASLSDTIAQRRYDSIVASFAMGRVSTLDLDNSQAAKDSQRVSYINSLYSYWSLYYQIRALTLYDFNSHTDLKIDIKSII